MSSVRVKENEPFDVALRRFKRLIEKTGLLNDLRAREYYEKPTWERKRKAAAVAPPCPRTPAHDVQRLAGAGASQRLGGVRPLSLERPELPRFGLHAHERATGPRPRNRGDPDLGVA